MKLGEWQRVKQILEPALELDRASRSAFVERACAGDERLRREVESLLAREEQAEGFLESPPLDLATRAIGADASNNTEVSQGNSVQSDPGLAGGKVSHYQILDKVGAGGMGVVYKARDLHLDRVVAIKVLPAGVADPERKRRFILEARAASLGSLRAWHSLVQPVEVSTSPDYRSVAPVRRMVHQTP